MKCESCGDKATILYSEEIFNPSSKIVLCCDNYPYCSNNNKIYKEVNENIRKEDEGRRTGKE